ncbi:TrpB-like pyridoxal phosphate-dependent enzyme [Candidatus Caldatribacterium sp.]|uniref:TrpB-like pyridoxal phosphate-dependent enzyme n=1 Tax=Candidatus Caldatribacterium sp. TaxID=2282143 RepID=UPI00299B11CA|nr:TrpB-like pyridoxal phosphate-dependent enzyme [Candidatus Caldatribacterium sp.]MDW8081991.1 TrpB-like pyridoxal phosphate-dependent enzyme [Candidatus Calescibacterium sp.]
MDENRILLSEREMPTVWYNILPDLPRPLDPPLHPLTREPVKPEDLASVFPPSLIEQEVSTKRFIDIPGEVIDVYRLWRPTPLIRARRLERALGTPARIYYKYEGVSPAGSHKPNTAVAQAYYNKKDGTKRLTTETGAGQWGSALAMACRFFGLACTVYMVRISYEQKPYRRVLMETWGAEVYPSPSTRTKAGREILAKDPASLGSLGIAISEAIEDAVTTPDSKYSLGSVLNHVLLHQTIIGEEAKLQLEKIGEYPDIIVGCVGGGSNFGGILLPFMRDKLEGKRDFRGIAVEPVACSSLLRGRYEYDYGDVAKNTPLLKMHTLGHEFIPPAIHAGGLRYHGMAPIISLLYDAGLIEAQAYHQNAVFEAAVLFARTEGFVVAPETAHAVKAVVEEAKKCATTGEEKVILFNCSGHGFLDLAAYDQYLSGKLPDVNHESRR